MIPRPGREVTQRPSGGRCVTHIPGGGGRQIARAEKNWAVADEVRDRMAKAGIEVTDTPNGPEWSLKAGQ